MSTAEPTPSTTPLTANRTLAGALTGSLVLMGAVLFMVLDPRAYPPVWVAAALGALAVAAHVVVEAVGYKVPPVDPDATGDEVRAGALAAYQSSMILRFAICESVAVIALVAAFLVEPQAAKTYLVGGTLSLLLLLWHVWPSERVIRRVEAALDRFGGRSHLGDALHGRPAGTARPR
jgi:membrane protein YdbS with pleckstrin-like domain